MSEEDAGPLPGQADDASRKDHASSKDHAAAPERPVTPAPDPEAWAEAPGDDERFTRERPPHW